VWVDDVLHRHGGTQQVCAVDIHGAEFAFPLVVQSGLMELNLRYPTQEEIDSLPVVWLTSDAEPWDPVVLDNTETKVVPQFDDFIDVSVNFVELQQADCWMKHVAQQDELLRAFAFCTGMVFIGRVLFRVMNEAFQNSSPKIKIVTPDFVKYRPLLGWQPLDTVRKTFEATTQLVKELPMRYPLRRHIKSQNPALNRRQLSEGFATDTLFSSNRRSEATLVRNCFAA
jgi:hypothetical protein